MNIELLRQFLDFYAVYLVTQLGRSVLCSFFLLPLFLALRITVFKSSPFLKGFLWMTLFLLPFIGKMKLFYENPFMVKAFLWWGNLCIRQVWLCWAYLLGAAVSFSGLFRQYRAIKKLVGKMEPYGEPGSRVVVGRLMAAPFSTGLLHPRIVLPEGVLSHCTSREVRLMALHERNHIRLGHLWQYFLWDLLRSLLWMNPLLAKCTKYFREDLEEACDKVTIQQSGGDFCEYGKLLLKVVQLLQEGQMAATVAFVGQGGYGQFKRRIQKIAGFQPYQRGRAICLCCACSVVLAGMFLAITYHSYPKYMEVDTYIMVSGSADEILISDSKALEQAVSRDGQNIYIKRKEMDALLQDFGIGKQEFFLGFGGYMKLPGMGGGGCSVYVDYAGSQGDLTIPYSEQESILVKILKII